MHSINVIGLGPGDKDQIPTKIQNLLKEADVVYLRSDKHPAANELKAEGATFESFDHLYKGGDCDLEAVHIAIADKLISCARIKEVLYAVPGHPMVAEKSVSVLMKRYARVKILGGKSVIDELLLAVEAEPADGLQLVSAFEMNADSIDTGQPVMIMQLLNALLAKKAKEVLVQKYPADHKVALIDAAGSAQEAIEWMPLNDIDQFFGVHQLRNLYVPSLEMDERVRSLSTLQYYIDRVTDPTEGDVWINEQTPASLIRYLKEETDEVVEAIEKEDTENWMEELGDVLVQLLYQTSIAEKEGEFTFEDVLETVNRKIRRRHPHVFDGVKAATAEEVDALWQKIKAEEKRNRNETR